MSLGRTVRLSSSHGGSVHGGTIGDKEHIGKPLCAAAVINTCGKLVFVVTSDNHSVIFDSVYHL